MLIKESQLRSIILSEIRRSYNHNSKTTLNEGINLNKKEVLASFLSILAFAGIITKEVLNNQEAKEKASKVIEQELNKRNFNKSSLSAQEKEKWRKNDPQYDDLEKALENMEELTKAFEDLAHSKELQNITKAAANLSGKRELDKSIQDAGNALKKANKTVDKSLEKSDQILNKFKKK